MRRVLSVSLAAAVAALSIATAAEAQTGQQRRQDPSGGGQNADGSQANPRDNRPRIAPLRRRAAAGPCPYVKILYDAARYVELTGERVSAQNVGWTGEIEGLTSDCGYQADEPITVQARILFNLGRGPQAQGQGRTYRYWIAVTERNKAVLAKEYFDLPVTFDGEERETSVTQDQTIVIPRAAATVAGNNFEILVGFDVTPQMAEFNASGSRFRVNAGTAAPAATTPPPAQ